MRWQIYAVFAIAAVVLDTSLLQVLTIRTVGDIRPVASIVVVTFVAMFAPRATALWAAWALGVLVDLCTDLPVRGGSVAYLIGPHALGYVFAVYLILQVRAMVFRRRVMTLGMMTIVSAFAASLAVIAIYSVRRWYPEAPLEWTQYGPTGELLRRLGIALYSGLLAIPLGWILLGTAGMWGFGSRA